MPEPNEDVVVSYSLKELLERFEGKLDAIDHKLDGKADQAQVDQHEIRIAKLEGDAQTSTEVANQLNSYRRYLFGLTVPSVISCIGIMAGAVYVIFT